MIKYFFIFSLFLFSCNSNDNTTDSLSINDIAAGNNVKESGKKLIDKPIGLIKIINDQTENDSTLIVAVHGYKSEGYEWVHFLNQFSQHYSNIYFYRYDWEQCPDDIGEKFANDIDSLLIGRNDIKYLEIYGHSYGGLVITFAGSDFETNKNIKLNTIASPLAGYPRIINNCDLLYNEQSKLMYSAWESNVSHHQWRTQKEQDGAFRDMDYDPQDIDLYNSTITVLPDSMDGHRLGHNWSVTWVTNYLLNHE